MQTPERERERARERERERERERVFFNVTDMCCIQPDVTGQSPRIRGNNGAGS